MANSIPNPPEGLSKRGRQFWTDVLEALDLEVHELTLLHECARVMDRLELLDEAGREYGALTPDGRAAPWLAEARQQQAILARLIQTLRLPDDTSADDLARGQRRGGARTPYNLRTMPNA
jgi:hypothetical protein